MSGCINELVAITEDGDNNSYKDCKNAIKLQNVK